MPLRGGHRHWQEANFARQQELARVVVTITNVFHIQAPREGHIVFVRSGIILLHIRGISTRGDRFVIHEEPVRRRKILANRLLHAISINRRVLQAQHRREPVVTRVNREPRTAFGRECLIRGCILIPTLEGQATEFEVAIEINRHVNLVTNDFKAFVLDFRIRVILRIHVDLQLPLQGKGHAHRTGHTEVLGVQTLHRGFCKAIINCLRIVRVLEFRAQALVGGTTIHHIIARGRIHTEEVIHKEGQRHLLWCRRISITQRRQLIGHLIRDWDIVTLKRHRNRVFRLNRNSICISEDIRTTIRSKRTTHIQFFRLRWFFSFNVTTVFRLTCRNHTHKTNRGDIKAFSRFGITREVGT